jgi:molybdopterin-guanine dinucleotide biosynthesis protein B
MKIISVIGLKNTGKNTLVTKIVKELVKRGYRIGTVKHSHHGFDLPGKDTWKHKEAGAELVVGSGKGTFFSFADDMELDTILNLMKFSKNLDFIVLEGFKHAKYAKISTSDLNDDYIIATVNVMNIDEDHLKSLVDLIEERSYGMIQELNCKKCGFENCNEYIKEKLSGSVTTEVECKTESDQVLLKINDNMIPLNPFVRSFIEETITGMVNSLKTEEFGVNEIKKIELLIRNE